MSFRGGKLRKWCDLVLRTLSRRPRTQKWILLLPFIGLLIVPFIYWTTLFSKSLPNPINFLPELQRLERAIKERERYEADLQQQLIEERLLSVYKPPSRVYLPVLLIACNRIEVKRTLDALLRFRNATIHRFLSNIPPTQSEFPITISHGCEHPATAKLLNNYADEVSIIHFKDSTTTPKTNLTKHQLPYRSVAHHYKYALDYIFLQQNHSALIVVEDDLDIAPDFFDYFAATLPLLQSDPSLFCASAWNDNGRPQLIDTRRNDLIYRSDFFSGLGWMLLRDFWLEIRDNWPDVFWDEYIRQPFVRQNRACLRPEIGRTVTFGRSGISHGQFFDRYMKTMVLNSVNYPFLQADLSYLLADEYIPWWLQRVYNDSIEIRINDLRADRLPQPELVTHLRVTYRSTQEFLQLAKFLNLMSDIKSGVMRNAFLGVVPVTWKRHTLYVAPPRGWHSYELTTK